MFCQFCHNQRVTSQLAPCGECKALFESYLGQAYTVWMKLYETEPLCCGGLVGDAAPEGERHLYFHGRSWDSSFPKTNERVNAPHVEVECGIAIYKDHACTYFLIDTGSDCFSYQYGEQFALPNTYDEAAWNRFTEQMFTQLFQAGEAAWNSDWLSCPECDEHYCCQFPHSCSEVT